MADRYSTQNLNRTLTQFALETYGLGGPFIADRIMPIVHVPTTVGKYYKFTGTEAHKDDYDAIRAPKAKSNRISRSYTEASYACQQYGLAEDIADEEMDNADRAIIDPERDSMTVITRKLRLAIELRVTSQVMSGTYVTNNGAATAAWNAASGVDIEGDIDAAKESVRKSCGMVANTIVIPPHISVYAKKDSSIRDLIKYTDPSILVNGDLPPTLFNLEVLIPTCIYDEAGAGISTASMDYVWDDNSVLVAYVEKLAPSKKSLSLGYQFRRPISGSLDIAAFRYPAQSIHATTVEGMIEQDEEVVCVGAGYLITTAYS